MTIECKRAYDDIAKADGYRVLVDRIWPRGIKKEALDLNDWIKDLAPSTELRKWFGHDPERWETFCKRYRSELEDHNETLQALLKNAGKQKITLIYGAKDREHNNAVVLKAVLEEL
ncbi:DUF488 domain-containing protein [Marinobacter sp. 1Y8]